MLRFFHKKAKGFTLIELLIVVAIIGILAAIAIPNLLGAQKRSRYARAAADTKTLTTQTQLYANDNNRYPTATANSDVTDSVATLRSAGYANVQSADPWGSTYFGWFSAAGTTAPAQGDHYLHYSMGQITNDNWKAGVTANVPPPILSNGSVGYSAVYGYWNRDTGT